MYSQVFQYRLQENKKHFFTDLQMNCCTKLCAGCEKYKSKMLDRGTRQRMSDSKSVRRRQETRGRKQRLPVCSNSPASHLQVILQRRVFTCILYVSGQRHIKTVLKKKKGIKKKAKSKPHHFPDCCIGMVSCSRD